MAKKPTYTKEFKERAVQLSVDSDKTLETIAKELQISAASLAKWRKEQGAAPPRGGQSELIEARRELETLRLKVKELEKEKRLAEMEREILKKAAVFFAKHQA